MSQVAPELQAEHQTWLTQIRSWEQEINSLSSKNSSISPQADSLDAKAKIEQFENRFTIERSRLDNMKHNIKVNATNRINGQSEMDEFARYFEALKSEFDSFRASMS